MKKSYYLVLADGSKVHFECEPSDLQKWVADLTRIYSKRGLRVVSQAREWRK